MKRFVTYIYEYERGSRGRNVGFIRTDIRDSFCRMEIHIRGLDRFKGRCTVYLAVTDDAVGIPAAEILISQGAGFLKLTCQQNRIGNSGYLFSDLQAVVIRYGSGKVLAGCFVNEPAEKILRGDFTILGANTESAPENARPVSAAASTAEPMTSAGEIPAEPEQPDRKITPSAPDTAGSRMAPSSPNTAGSRMAPSSPNTADSRMAPSSPNTAGNITARSMPQQPDNRASSFVPDMTEKRPRPSVPDTTGNRTVPTVPNTADNRTVPSVPNPTGDRIVPSSPNTVGSRTVPPSPNTVGSRTVPPSPDIAGSRTVPPSPDTAGGRMTPYVPDTAGNSTAPSMPQQPDNRNSSLVPDMNENRTRPSAPGTTGNRTVPSPNATGSSTSPSMPEQHDNRNSSFVPDMTAPAAVPPSRDMEKKTLESMSAPAGTASLRRIGITDIRSLPKCNWKLCNNSFLVHGFFNYHYLILKTVENGDKKQQFIGVPGIYEQPERMMALLFGFPEFEAAENNAGKPAASATGTFGYWMCPLSAE